MGLDTLMVLQSRLQLLGQPLTLDGIDLAGGLEVVLGVGRPARKRFAQSQQMTLGLPHDFNEHSTLAPALAAKTTHRLLQVAYEHLALDLEHSNRGRTGEALRDVIDYLEDFFWAL